MNLEPIPSACRRGSSAVLAAALLAFVVPSTADDCCSCAVNERTRLAKPEIPCLFDVPKGWDVEVGDDGALLSAVAGPSCDAPCANGAPGMAVSFGTKPDSNADTMEEIWTQVMPVVGSARCGEGTVTFFSPPGADETGPLGGVKFFVAIGGRK